MTYKQYRKKLRVLSSYYRKAYELDPYSWAALYFKRKKKELRENYTGFSFRYGLETLSPTLKTTRCSWCFKSTLDVDEEGVCIDCLKNEVREEPDWTGGPIHPDSNYIDFKD